MALWGKTDVLGSVPKFIAAADVAKTFFVDTTEVGVAANRAKGIQTPGWNSFVQYTDSLGNTRRRVEPLVVMKMTAGAAGDAGTTGVTATEDATVADT